MVRDKYGTHLPMLCTALQMLRKRELEVDPNAGLSRLRGRVPHKGAVPLVTEHGCGQYSTPVIQAWCKTFGWNHTVIESNDDWYFESVSDSYVTTRHTGLSSIQGMRELDVSMWTPEGVHLLLVVVDGITEERRPLMDYVAKLRRLYQNAYAGEYGLTVPGGPIMVVHDVEEPKLYNYDDYTGFNSLTTDTTCKPHTGLYL